MLAMPACCSEPGPTPFGELDDDGLSPCPQPTLVSSAAGITVDDLIDAAQKISYNHRLCPYAHQVEHNPQTGEVEVPVTFMGTLKVQPHDPVLPQSRASHPVSQGSWDGGESPGWDPQEKTEEEVEMEEYIDAKHYGKPTSYSVLYNLEKVVTDIYMIALASGLPIPTLAEWREEMLYSQPYIP